jgi:hypothetical protein
MMKGPRDKEIEAVIAWTFNRLVPRGDAIEIIGFAIDVACNRHTYPANYDKVCETVCAELRAL